MTWTLSILAVYMLGITAGGMMLRKRALVAAHWKYLLLLFGAALMILPFYWMVITSFKALHEASAHPPTWWPNEILWNNYVEAWNKPEVGFARYYWVTVYTTVLSTIGVLATGMLAAYAFAKMQFPGRYLFFYLVLATLMVPGQVLIIPNYIIQIGRASWRARV